MDSESEFRDGFLVRENFCGIFTEMKTYKKLFSGKFFQFSEDADDAAAQRSALTPANHAVIGVFKRYIEIDNPQILIPTALEFIHCIVHYLQSTEGFEQGKFFA
jgi:hypothetical protein